MTESRNLTLDLDQTPGGRGQREPIARIAVSSAWGFTRHGGAAVVTRDCTSYAALEREVTRLREELDAALSEAGRHLAGATSTRKPAPAKAPEPASGHRLASLDTSLRVANVMTREVRTLGPNDRLALAEELMQQGRFRHVVVVDEGAVVGVVSQRDIFHGALAWSLGHGKKAHETLLASSLVKDVMASNVVTIDPDAALQDAAALLRERKLGCLPVVAGDELVGILTEGDFLALLARPA